MSLGYLYVFFIAAWAQSRGYIFGQDPINTPTVSMAAIYVVCQLVGLSLLGWVFQPLTRLWTSVIAVSFGLLIGVGLAFALPIFRKPELLPFVMYGCAGAALGYLAAQFVGAVVIGISSVCTYFVALYGEQFAHVGEFVARHLPTSDGSARFGQPVSLSLVAETTAQIFINVVFATLIAVLLKRISAYSHSRRSSPY